MPQITTNSVKRYPLSQTDKPRGIVDEHIVAPAPFAVLWREITGRATVTDADIERLKALANFFHSGLAITRNNRPDTMAAKVHVRKYTKHPEDPRESDPLFVIYIDPKCGHLWHIETDSGSGPAEGDGYECPTCGADVTVGKVTHQTIID